MGVVTQRSLTAVTERPIVASATTKPGGRKDFVTPRHHSPTRASFPGAMYDLIPWQGPPDRGHRLSQGDVGLGVVGVGPTTTLR